MRAEQALPLDDRFVITFDRTSYTVAEWARACGLGETTIRDHIKGGYLIPQYPNSKAIITLEEGLRWLRSLPAEDPAQVAS